MVEILSFLSGGIFRIVPEIMKFFDAKNERQHELDMLQKNMDYDKLRGEINAQAQEKEIDLTELKGMLQAAADQAKPTGNKFADSMSALVRPFLAFQWLLFIWPLVIFTSAYQSFSHGMSVADAMQLAFGPDERALAASIASFWLVDRSLKSKLFKK